MRVIPDATVFDCISTAKDSVKNIWWYDILEDRLEGYNAYEVEKHVSPKFNLKGIEESGRFVRGKVLKYNNKNYLLMWTVGYQAHLQSVIEKVLNKIELDFDIECVIDEVGNEIYRK